jgi:ribosomal protein S12 methylthiotransferase
LTYYGLDIYKKRALPELLDALCEVEGIEWIRLHYAYPSKFPIDIIETMKRQPKVCNYLDIPLQHAADNVLEAMKRQVTRAETTALIKEIRSIIPEITIRTTMLVGFPGETEDDFEDLCDFVREMEFERLGVFQYSHEENTSAHDLEDDVPAEIKADRANRLMEIQQAISFAKNDAKVGKIFKTLIDRKEGGYFVGRTESDSAEVDNEVLVDASKHFLRIGDFCDLAIIDAEDYDLYGEPIVT